MTGDDENPGGPLGFDDDPAEDADTGRSGAARRFEAADAADEDGGDRRSPVRASGLPRGSSRYGWFVGVVAVLAIAVITISTVGTDGISSTGLDPGEDAPPFAAPLALSDLEGDVNVAREPDSGEAGSVPACEVTGPDILNLCELVDDRPVALAFFATRGGRCIRALDTLDDLRRRHPELAIAAISIRGDRDDVRDLVRERRWGFPVGYDSDGILANLYGVAVCPQIALIREGGVVFDTILGEAPVAELDERLGALVDAPPPAGEAGSGATEGARGDTVAP